jgi:sialate O-acetylesterase
MNEQSPNCGGAVRSMRSALFLALLLLTVNGVFATITIPAFFSDNMVLQQKSDIAIWGWASPGEMIVLTVGWNKKIVRTITDSTGKWMARLQTIRAGGPYTITLSGDGPIPILIRNVWLGEVWLCSGQSNMNFPIAKLASWRTGVYDYEKEIAASGDSLLRMFTVEQAVNTTPQKDVKGSWQLSGPSTAGNFSAVAYYFAREIRKATGIAVGIIHSSVGGTPAESWVSDEVLHSDTAFSSVLERYKKAVKTDPKVLHDSKSPSVLYNAMIHPLVPYTIRGICWYQGETNSDRAYQYRRLFPALIDNWRKDWGARLPFYFVQIAPHYSKVPEIREAQFLSYRLVPNTGMVVITDAGDSLNIHPRNKKIVGERLALWALAKDYGFKHLTCSGPLYKDMQIEGDKIRVRFDFTGSGLVAWDGELREFMIAGSDGNFVPARAVIEGKSIVVSSEQVKEPVAVRFAWKNFPQPNLYNKEGLPASPFRTDEWR